MILSNPVYHIIIINWLLVIVFAFQGKSLILELSKEYNLTDIHSTLFMIGAVSTKQSLDLADPSERYKAIDTTTLLLAV